MGPAIAFDVDGTLIDSIGPHLQAWSWAFTQYGRDISLEELQTQFGRRADFFVRHFMPRASDQEIEEIVAVKRRYYRERLHHVRVFPGVTELLIEIRKRNVKLGIATSASRMELDWYMKEFGFTELVDAAISGSETRESKPKPEIIFKIFGLLGVPSSSGVYVGDSPHDMRAAVLAEAAPVGVLTGGYSSRALEKEGAMAVFESVGEIDPDYLVGLSRRKAIEASGGPSGNR
ncbi:MAG: HAD family hydrolase [Candidatus Aquicultorales bacterium]